MKPLTNKRYEDQGFAVNIFDLIRPPYSHEKLPGGWIDEKPRFYPAPNRKLCLVTSHFIEWRMGWTSCLFNLIDLNGKTLETFKPLLASDIRPLWNADGRYCILRLWDYRTVLIVDLKSLKEKQFSLFKIKTSDYCDLHFDEENTLFLSCDVSKAQDALNQKVEKGELTPAIPLRRHIFPEERKIVLRDLDWYAFDCLAQWEKKCKKIPEYDMQKKEAGFYTFRGRYPESTVERIVAHFQLRMEDLQLFAEYGEKQCIDWYLQAFKKSRGYHAPYDVVEKFIGEQTRGSSPEILETLPVRFIQALKISRKRKPQNKALKAKGCPECFKKNNDPLRAFNWKKAQKWLDSCHRYVRSLDYKGRARKGWLYQCVKCAIRWYLRPDGQTMVSLWNNYDTFHEWNKRDLPMPSCLNYRLNELNHTRLHSPEGDSVDIFSCAVIKQKEEQETAALIVVTNSFPDWIRTSNIGMIDEVKDFKKTKDKLSEAELQTILENGKCKDKNVKIYLADKAVMVREDKEKDDALTVIHEGSVLTILSAQRRRAVDLKFEIGNILIRKEKIVVRFKCVGDATPVRNVLCLNSAGQKVWQIEEPATWRTALWQTYREANDTDNVIGIRRDYLSGVGFDKDGNLWAGGAESRYRVDIETGKILEEIYTK